MEDYETIDNNDIVEDEADAIEEYHSEEGGCNVGPAMALVGLGAVIGIVVDKFVAPAIGNAVDSARNGLVKMLSKDYTEIESKQEDSDKTDK